MRRSMLAFVLTGVMAAGMAFSAQAAVGDNSELVVVDSEWYGLDTFQLDGSAGGQGYASTTLFQWDAEQNRVVDNICTDWTVSEDGSKITFNVPEGMVYSTGESVEPEDVKASIEHGLEVSPYCEGYDMIESIDIDGRQVTLNLSRYSCDMEYYFCADFICLIDKDELDSMSDEELMWGCHPYGPYYLADGGYISGSEVNLVRHDGYISHNPLLENKGPWHFEKVKFRFNVEDFTVNQEVLNGTVDYLMSCSRDQYQELKDEPSLSVVNAAYPCINYFEMNTDSPVFEDIRVRQALALAINREAIAEIAQGAVVPAYSMIYDTMQCFSQEAYDYFKENLANDPDKAMALLDEAGWVDEDGDGIREKDGEKLEFTMYGWESWSTILSSLAFQLQSVGIQMNLEILDWNYIYENIDADEYDTGMESLEWAEPILILNICYYDNNAPGNDDTYREMIKKCSGAADTTERIQAITDIQKYMFENVNIIPLFGDNGYEIFNGQLKGYKVQKDGTTLLGDMTY